MTERLDRLEPGMAIVYGGESVARVSPELAEAFVAGDRLVVVQDSGDLLHIPALPWPARRDSPRPGRQALNSSFGLLVSGARASRCAPPDLGTRSRAASHR